MMVVTARKNESRALAFKTSQQDILCGRCNKVRRTYHAADHHKRRQRPTLPGTPPTTWPFAYTIQKKLIILFSKIASPQDPAAPLTVRITTPAIGQNLL